MIRSGISALGAALLLALPQPAEALSCLRPDIARSYQQADRSKDRYIMVLGTLAFDPALLPETGAGNTAPTTIPARLNGQPITPNGFGKPFQRPVTLEISCAGSWCGSVPAGTEMLMFLRQTAAGYTLDVGPCPGSAFVQPSEETLATARRCLSGGPCQPRRR